MSGQSSLPISPETADAIRLPRIPAIVRVILLLLLLCPFCRAWSCLNESGTTRDAKRAARGHEALILRLSLKTELRERGAAMESGTRGSIDFTNRNDYAVALIYQGRLPEAIDVLQDLEKQKPGDYSVAANLGTALELAGRNEEALKWIQEGIRRNPDSHQGTEWVHVKILEAKIQAATNPNYFKEHSVLDLDQSRITEDATTVTVGGQSRDLDEVKMALGYQLKERLQFVKTQDAPVASLLFDYAAILAATATLESAKQVLQMAVEFGYPVDKVQPLLARYDRIIRLSSIRQGMIYGSIALSVIAFLVYAVRQKWITVTRSAGKTPHTNPLKTSRIG